MAKLISLLLGILEVARFIISRFKRKERSKQVEDLKADPGGWFARKFGGVRKRSDEQDPSDSSSASRETD